MNNHLQLLERQQRVYLCNIPQVKIARLNNCLIMSNFSWSSKITPKFLEEDVLFEANEWSC